MWPEIKRKIFHMTAMIYVVGIIYLPRRTYLLILAAVLAMAALVELARLRRPSVNDWLMRRFAGLVREQERRRPSGITWMLAGVTATVALVEPARLAVTALLYLVLGDAVASLIGIRLGGPKWPGSGKRLSGSLACLLVCLVIGATLLPPEYGWHGVFIGAVVATAVEWGLVPVDDNFSIPIASSIALLASYRVPPFGGLL
jgi:dolichol kinase